ncbi:MAG: molybdenum cofactor guanylyltransferase MobA [Pararhodobacter sp.]
MGARSDIAGVILAGGRATRLGGGDKGLLALGGRSVLDHVIARLAPQVAALALNANGDPARFAPLGLPVLPDLTDDRPGPLAGILAAMLWAAGRGDAQVLTVAGDTPFLPVDLVVRLAAAGPFAMAESPDEAGAMRAHPTIALWPVALADTLAESLARGEHKVGRWAQEHGARRVPFTERPDPFFNINTPADLHSAQARLA